MWRFNKAFLVSLTIAMIAGNSLMASSANAQRYLVNGHAATEAEEQHLVSYGFAAGAWRMDGWGVSPDASNAAFIPSPRAAQCRYVLDVPLDCDIVVASR